MPINRVLTIRGSLTLPSLTVTPTDIILEGDSASQSIRIEWSRFQEFIDLMFTAKESALLLGFITEETADKNQRQCPDCGHWYGPGAAHFCEDGALVLPTRRKEATDENQG